MADKSIADLPVLQAVDDTTQIPVWQPGATNSAQKLAGSKFREFAEQAAEQYVEDATQVVQRAEQALDSLGDSAAKAKQSADNAAESERKAKLYADQTEASVSGVASFNGRGGHVVPQSGDYTADMVGAAPAGFGLGGAGAPPPNISLNDAKANGWYYAGPSYEGAPEGIAYLGYGMVHTHRREADNIVQEYFTGVSAATGTPYKLMRQYNENGWSEWEWDNPPLVSGVEYRTTERYMGKPVYVRVVNVGEIVENTTKTITVLEGNAHRLVSLFSDLGSSTGNSVTLNYDGSLDDVTASIISGVLTITVKRSTQTYGLRCIVKYTKTTD